MTIMKTTNMLLAAGLALAWLWAPAGGAAPADPLIASWQTDSAGQYARIYTNSTMQLAGDSLTTWSNGSQTQSAPAYAGVQQIYSSSNWVYVRSTGLASFTMGPWQPGFPNLPENQKSLFRFPRTNAVPAAKTSTEGGAIGMFVDGVAMFNSWDAFTYDPGTGSDTAGYTGYWNRDAYVNEGATFDPAYAHQQNTGTYHYHASPIALRYQLGDHVDYNATAKTWSEATNPPAAHSPLLGWVADGFPVYGPYGYSNPTNANSGVRRMISGYVIRNGQYGTSNLTLSGRTTIPEWAVRLYNVSSNQAGPAVTSSYPLGRYMEDNDYLGDLGYSQGVDFDLDQYNGRWCVTPEYPNGTYAYFVAIASNGIPVFPYNIGRGYYGSPTGGAVTAITESVSTNFLGETNLLQTLHPPVVGGGTIALTWSALEGGTYTVAASSNLVNWNAVNTGVAASRIAAGVTNPVAGSWNFYRVARTAVAAFDSAGSTTILGGSGIATAVVPGGSASPGTTVTVTITLPTMPPWPPANAPTPTVTLAGSIPGENVSVPASGTVLATFVIPTSASKVAQNVVVTYSPGPTYTLTGGFTIN